VHSELHVRLIVGLSTDHKHLLFAVVCDTVLCGKVAERNDVGYCIKPNLPIVTCHRGFLSDRHGASIAL
jgi:hypothetical protein